MADVPNTELVLSPRWTVSVGDIDGTPHVVLRIHHPRLGPLDFLLPNNDAVEFAAALEKTWERRDEARMRRAARPSDAHIETIHPPRQTHSYWWSWLIRSAPVVTTKFIARLDRKGQAIQKIGLTVRAAARGDQRDRMGSAELP